MRGEFNQRFGQNSKDRNNMLTQLFPFASVPQTDPETGVTDSLHRRLDERESDLRVFYTNTSAEYHRGDASLIHTDPDGKTDVEHGPKVRIYHFTGTEHGTGHVAPDRYFGLRRGNQPHSERPQRHRLRATSQGVPGEP